MRRDIKADEDRPAGKDTEGEDEDEDGTILRATKEEFENAQNVVDATLAWGVSYERCVDKDNRLADGTCVQIQHQQRRIEAAEKIYGYFVNGEDIDLGW